MCRYYSGVSTKTCSASKPVLTSAYSSSSATPFSRSTSTTGAWSMYVTIACMHRAKHRCSPDVTFFCDLDYDVRETSFLLRNTHIDPFRSPSLSC